MRQDLETQLQGLVRRIEETSPTQDRRRTNDCPTITALTDFVTGEYPVTLKREHIQGCTYCQSVIAAVRREQEQMLPMHSGPVTDTTAELRRYVASWFREHQPKENEEIGGRFDEYGTLHLSLSDLTVSGPVRVRLVADGAVVPLIETEVVGSRFEATIPLPDWDLRNVRVARACVEVLAGR